ncbi:MAG: GH33 [uncultured Solirubrobacteraceae bacterium]|uniref:GH33 n=1 Tax=uncultured Solirubrobacteraceae bacterium TaxID=1162706 RepID=A0A6J4T9L9_9ACTN|nr:MAG: GH33 [uncultured Solirubrobacteraceae bacterium]
MALLLVGIVLIVVSLLQGDTSRVDADDAPVNVGAGNLSDISAHNSPTVVRSPRDAGRLVATSRIDSPDFSCAVHVSSDGGERWTRTRVPIPRGRARKCYAPDAVFAADGTLHVSYVTLQGAGNTPSAAWIASSRDGGRTLSAPRRVAGPLAFQVRLTSDPERAGTLYLSWVQARSVATLRFTGPGNPILIARSDDAGRTWSSPARVNAAGRGRVLAPSAAVGRGGELYVLYLDVGDDRLDYEGGHEGFGGPPYAGRFTLVLGRSRDRGATWEESVVDDGVVPTTRFIAFLPPFPSLAVDRDSGRIHVAYQDGRLGSADVWLWTLDPQTSSWGRPVRVNDTPRRDGTSQYLPQIDVAPDGRVDVVYYDRRDDGRRDVLNEVSLQTSDDGGRTFAPRISLTSSYFDSRVGFGSERDLPELGSRLGLVSDANGAFAVWSDTRAGTDASSKQDLYRAAVEVGQRQTAASVLLFVGAALALGGVLLAGAAVRRRRPE